MKLKYYTFAVAWLAAGVVISAVGIYVSRIGGLWLLARQAYFPSSIFFGYYFTKYYNLARRDGLNVLSEISTRAVGSFILYLRSFDSDVSAEFTFTPGSDPPELALERGLRDSGMELVAIGRPGDSVPPVGAKRIYLADDEWEEKVIDYMNEASLIILRVGETAALSWEMNKIIDLGYAYKTLLFCPLNTLRDFAYEKQLANILIGPNGRVRREINAPFIFFNENSLPRVLELDRGLCDPGNHSMTVSPIFLIRTLIGRITGWSLQKHVYLNTVWPTPAYFYWHCIEIFWRERGFGAMQAPRRTTLEAWFSPIIWLVIIMNLCAIPLIIFAACFLLLQALGII